MPPLFLWHARVRWVCCALLLGALSQLSAQTSALEGVIRGGGGVPGGARVEIEPRLGNVHSSVNGRFRFDSLPAGLYTLTVAAPGYRTSCTGYRVGPNEQRSVVVHLERAGTPAASPNGSVARATQFDLLPAELLRQPDGERAFSASAEASPGEVIAASSMKPIPERNSVAVRTAGGVSTPIISEGYTVFRTAQPHIDLIKQNGEGYLATPSDFTVEQLRIVDVGIRPNWLLDVVAVEHLLGQQLGVSLAASAQQSYQEIEAVRTPYGVNADNAVYVANRQGRTLNVDKQRYTLDARFEYLLGENHRLNALLSGSLRASHELRLLDDTVVAGQGAINNSLRATPQEQHSLGATLAGTHRLGSFDVRWTGALARLEQSRPDRSELRLYRAFDTAAGGVVTGPLTLSALLHDWLVSSSNEQFAGIDVGWRGELAVQVGGAVRNRERSNVQNDYRLVQRVDSAHGGTIPPFVSLDAIDVEVRNPGGTPLYGTNNYTCRENVAAVYFAGNYTLDSVRVTAGVRAERTVGHYEAFDPNSVSVISANKSYTDLLPNVQVRYGLAAGSSVRLSIARAIVRPNYYDLVPYSTIAGDQQIAGNPYLERSRAMNVDARYEVVPPGFRSLAVVGFYRVITDPIERTIDIRNPTLPTLSARNFGTAHLGGVSVAAAAEPGAGVRLEGSYTWSHSSITSSKVVFNRAAGTTTLVDETRELQGQPTHAAQVAAAYRDTATNLYFQLGLTYVGQRLYQVSLYRAHNDYLEPTAVVDLVVEKMIRTNESGGNVTLFARAHNLLDAAWQLREQSGLLLEREQYGVGMSVGFSYLW